MNIREPQSVLALLAESFKLVNRSIGTLLLLGFVSALLSIGVGALVFVHVPVFIIKILSGLVSVFMTVVSFQVVAALAENQQVSITEKMSSSVFPAIYTIILNLCIGITVVLAGLLFGVIAGGMRSTAVLVVFGLLGLFLFLRFCFAPMAIALQEENPISALMHSWQLTGDHLLKVITCWLVSVLLPIAFIGVCGYGLYVAIPLYFADSFNLASPSLVWILVFLLLFVVFVFISVSVWVYWILVYLNLTYSEDGSFQEVTALPQTQVTMAEQDHALSEAETEQSQVLKMSIKSQEGEGTIEQHLEQVYQPKPEDIVEYTEEDRMPTILFDDEMAKQMEADRSKWEAEKNKSRSKTEGDDDIIKMSK